MKPQSVTRFTRALGLQKHSVLPVRAWRVGSPAIDGPGAWAGVPVGGWRCGLVANRGRP